MNVISPGKFRSQMQCLSGKGFRAVPSNETDAPKTLYLTFDDAYECIYSDAFPICSEVDFKGIIFVISDYIGKSNDWDIHFGINKSRHLSKRQICELSQAGWEIASHGRTHRAHTGMKQKEILQDMLTSRQLLEDIVGKPVVSYTPPFNAFLPSLFKQAVAAGYNNVFLQKPITPNPQTADIRVIERRMVYNFDTAQNIVRKVENSSRYELYKENVIHFCANATIGVRSLLQRNE